MPWAHCEAMMESRQAVQGLNRDGNGNRAMDRLHIVRGSPHLLARFRHAADVLARKPVGIQIAPWRDGYRPAFLRGGALPISPRLLVTLLSSRFSSGWLR